jgi:hypothetical protein
MAAMACAWPRRGTRAAIDDREDSGLGVLFRCCERMQSGDRLLVIEMVPMPGEPDLDIALLDTATMVFGGEGSATKRRRVPERCSPPLDSV